MGENDLKILKTECPDKWKYLAKKLAFPYEQFNSLDDFQKPDDNLKKEYFFSESKNECHRNKKKKRQNELLNCAI